MVRWHSHYSTQYTDGLFGGMVLHSPNEIAARPIVNNATSSSARSRAYDSEVVLLMGDLYNTFSTELSWRVRTRSIKKHWGDR